MSCYPFQVVSSLVMNRSGQIFYIGGNDVLPAPLEPMLFVVCVCGNL